MDEHSLPVETTDDNPNPALEVKKLTDKISALQYALNRLREIDETMASLAILKEQRDKSDIVKKEFCMKYDYQRTSKAQIIKKLELIYRIQPHQLESTIKELQQKVNSLQPIR